MARGVSGCEQSYKQRSQEREGGKAKRKATGGAKGEINKLAVTYRDRPGGARENAAVKAFTLVPFKRRD